ncbi:AI-2E family transporter [Alicyclobacillus fodiniaquatilis]|uniref:AI-2E family transporter n=1 Tax=Alicyclobacillus fodiniaquatilis TaxID=1661150 RepID=A0ABW4JL60_9BACL
MGKSEKELKIQHYMGSLLEIVGSLLLVVLILVIFAFVFKYIVPFVLAALLAVVFLPIVRLLERLGLPRIASVLISMLGSVVILALLCTFAAIAIANEATTFSSTLAPYFAQLEDWIEHPTKLQALFLGHLPPHVAAEIQNQAVHSLSGIEHWIQLFANVLLNLVTEFPDWLFIIGIALVATYFMLINRTAMYHSFVKILPPGWEGKISATIRDMIRAFVATIRVQLILMAMSGALAMIAMWILHIPDAFIMGLLFGLAAIIPFIGSFIITIPWAIGSFAMGDTSLGIKVLLIQVIILLIVHMITPKLTANNVGLDTLSTLFALYVGMKIIGFTGIFIGPVLLIGIKSLLRKHLIGDLFPGVDTLQEHPDDKRTPS